ncbi:MAG: universal stress protein [Pseudomonadota bacterium]|nr:universal stress protein [Pseudomonadota bacterium]
MKNRFIVLIDFASNSEQLLLFAHDWGERVGAELLAFHNTTVFSPLMTPYRTKATLIDRANYEARERLVSFTRSILPPSASIQHLVSEDNMVSVLRELLKKPFNHLIFLGIKGTGLLKKIFIGSQAVNVIDGIDNLIVAMPQHAPCCAPEAIHVAVQKSYPLNLAELERVIHFNGEVGSKIIFFSVVTPEDDREATEEYLQHLTRLYSEKKETAYELYLGDHAWRDLKRIIKQKQNEFIVVQRGARMFLDQMTRKFLINDLVYEGHTPLIIMP